MLVFLLPDPLHPLPEAVLTCPSGTHTPAGTAPPRRASPRPPRSAPRPARAASSASPAPRGDHNMAAAPGLLLWLLLLRPLWRVPGQPNPDTVRRFSQHKLCADDECSSECPGGRRGGGVSAAHQAGRGAAGRTGGAPRWASPGSLRLSPPALPAPGPAGPSRGGLHLPLVASCSFFLRRRRRGWVGGRGWPPVSLGTAHSVPSLGPPRLRGRMGWRAALPGLPALPASAILLPRRGPRWVQSGGRCAKGSVGAFPAAGCWWGSGKASWRCPFAPLLHWDSGLGPPFEQGLEFRFGTSPESRLAVCSKVSSPALPQFCHFCAWKAPANRQTGRAPERPKSFVLERGHLGPAASSLRRKRNGSLTANWGWEGGPWALRRADSPKLR